MKIAAHINRFTFGETSPLLGSRTDVAKYPAGCKTMVNFLPLLQGAARRRGGTRFVAKADNGAKPVALLDFVYSDTTSYIVEAGDKYMRFYTDGAPVMNGATPYQIATPWTQADLFYASGICALKYVQSGDVMYIVCPGKPPQKLMRYGVTDWRIAALPGWGTRPNATAVALWRERLCLAAGQKVHISQAGAFENFELTSRALPGATVTLLSSSWSISASQSAGTVVVGLVWEGKAYSVTTSFDPEEATVSLVGSTATITARDIKKGLTRLGFVAVGTANYFAISANSLLGTLTAKRVSSPMDVARLTVDPKYSSMTTDPAVDLGDNTSVGYIVRGSDVPIAADDPLEVAVYSEQMDRIEWLCSAGDLLVGTTGGEFTIGETTTVDPFGPENSKCVPETAYGSSAIQPLRVGPVVLFAQRAGRKLREFIFDSLGENYKASDVAVAAEHITKGGLTGLAWQSEPIETLWATRPDGQLIGLTYSPDQEMAAWHRHILGGEGAVSQLAVVPARHGGRDELWLSVQREILGQTVYYIETLDHGLDLGEAASEAFFVDSGITVRGKGLTEITGLGHLERCEVAILGDGGVQPPKVVSGGKIILDRPADVVQVGLPYTSTLTTLNFEASLADGTAQGRIKRIVSVILRLLESGGGAAGPGLGQMDELEYRLGSDDLDRAVPLFTGDKRLAWPGGYETGGTITVIQTYPLPFTLLALIASIDIGGQE